MQIMLPSVLAAMVLAISSTAVPANSIAQDRAPSRPVLLENLLACREVSAADTRLACFDAASTAFQTAERQGEVTVIDRQQAQDTRTRLFGLNLDTANLFGGLRQDNPIESIETTLSSASRDGRGQWTFVLADGSIWRQIDTENVTSRPGPGVSVRIRQAAMGSYLLSVDGARSVRARRER